MNDKQMNDKQIGTVLRTWMEEESTQKPDRSRVVSNVVGQLRSARKPRRRWWPFRRRSDSLLTTNTTDKTPPPPHLAPVGGTPTITGRTQSMFSPAKAITAGALVFALGGVLLIAQPFDQQGGSVPGAEVDAEPVPPAFFTAEIGWADSCDRGTLVPDLDIERQVGWSCGPQTWTATDPRFTGSARNTWDHDVYRLEEGVYSVTVGHMVVENEGGRWVCSYEQLETGVGISSRPIDGGFIGTCSGSGDYDGLSALVSLESADRQTGVKGLVFEGELPPGPEVPAEE